MSCSIYYHVNNGESIIDRCISDDAQITIPAEIDGYAVTELGADCFAGVASYPTVSGFYAQSAPVLRSVDNKTLKRIELPNTLRKIGARCFAHCTALPRVNLPQSVTELGERVFHFCRALQRIELPSGITELPDYTFAECRQLLRISLPHRIHSIGRCCFYNCTHLERLDLPDTLQTIGDRMLMNCFALKELSFKLGVNAGALLPEIDRVLRINVNMGDEVIQMVLPEFATEYEELIQAKQFRTHEYGSGALYRGCFSDRDIDFELYDDYFYYCLREDPPELAAELAFDRLRYPVRLRPAKEQEYWDYLLGHVKELGAVLLTRDSLEDLEFVLNAEKLDSDALKTLSTSAERAGNVRFVSRLLEASGSMVANYFGFGADKLFEL